MAFRWDSDTTGGVQDRRYVDRDPLFPQTDEEVGTGTEFLGVDFDANVYTGEAVRCRLVWHVMHEPSELHRSGVH